MMRNTFFLERNGTKLAYAFLDVFGALGYVRHVVVDPGARGRGVGRRVMDEIADRFRAKACERWELNVKRDNAPAIRLYERVGMRIQFSTTVVKIDWAEIGAIAPGPERATARTIEPADDARLERDLRLADGKIDHYRNMNGQLLIGLVDARGETAGFARFDPGFPGAFPFRVAAPGYVRALLEAMRASKRAEFPWVQLVIENDAASAKLLFDAGARLVFEILHMGGSIPRA